MSNFERTYQIDPSREKEHQREMHPSIELSDEEYLARKEFLRTGNYVKFNKGPKFDDTPIKLAKQMEEAGFVYKEPVMDEDSMSPALKEKFEKARKITKDTKVIDLRKKDAKSKSKSPKSKAKKDNPKPNSAAVAQVQTEL